MDKTSLTKNTHLQADTSQPTNKSLQESIFSPTQEKLKNKKKPPFQKNKTSQPHNPRQAITLTGYYIRQMDTTIGQGRRRASANSIYPQVVVTWLNQVQCFYQSLYLTDSEVLQNHHLRVAANRYKQYPCSRK